MKRCSWRFTVVTAAMVFLGFASPALAIQIVYQITGVASGTIGGSPFTNALVTVTLTGDTSNVAAGGGCPTCLVNVGTTTVNIPGIGTATVTDATEILSTGIPIVPDVGFPNLPYVVIGILDNPPATDSIVGIAGVGSNSLLNYGLQTSIGPITAIPGTVGHDPCCVIHTTLGDLVFASNFSPTSQGTFTATAAAGATAARPARVIYTDIWYTGVESGQGYNLVQSENFIFVTFFIYGPTGAPTWYIAALEWNGVNSFTGPVSVTTGTFFGVPWVPGNLTETEVGTASFTPSTANAHQGTFSYTVTNVGSATKAIERQTLTSIVLAGSYLGSMSGTSTGCVDPGDNGTSESYFNLVVNQQANGNATFEFAFDDGQMCTLAGTLVPHGSLYTISGATMNCPGKGLATGTVRQIAATAQGIEGNFSIAGELIGSGCTFDASISAVTRRAR